MDTQVSSLETNAKAAETTDSTFLSWDYAKTKMVALRDAWTTGEERQTQIRRDLRSIRVDVEAARQGGELEADETFVPIRIIDSNIIKEAAPFIEYLTQPDRLAIMKPATGVPERDMTLREREFTRVMRYTGWILPFIKVQDGAATHGWDSVEIIFDESKPGHVAIDHVRHDELLMPQDVRNIQDCEFVMRKYLVSLTTIRKLIKTEGFIEERMQRVMDAIKTPSSSTASIAATLFPIYKIMTKINGEVYQAWWSSECDDGWLDGDMKKLFLGRHQLQMGSDGQIKQAGKDSRLSESQYPYYLLYYRETEMPEVFQHVGRVFLDEPRQDSATSLMTAFVNGTTRASNFIGSPKVNTDGVGKPALVPGVEIRNGGFYNMPIEFTNLPYPDAALLKGIQTIQNLNAEETQSPAFATMARKDSRKSATELNMAQDAQVTLSGVSLVMRAVFLTQVFTRCEEIVTSRALAGLVKHYCERDGRMDVELLTTPIQLRPAGDVDVVERKERLQAMMMGWSIIQATPAASIYLQDMLKLALPGYGEKYAQLLAEGDPKAQFIQQMLGAVTKIVTDPATGKLWPMLQPFAPKLQQLAQQAQAVLAPPQQQAPSQGQQG